MILRKNSVSTPAVPFRLLRVDAPYQFFVRLTTSVLNHRTLLAYFKKITLNSLLILVWVFLTALLNYIPRPSHICSRGLLWLERYLFDIHTHQSIGAVTFLLCIASASWLLARHYRITPVYEPEYTSKRTFLHPEPIYPIAPILPISSCTSSGNTLNSPTSSFQLSRTTSPILEPHDFSSSTSDLTIAELDDAFVIESHFLEKGSCRPVNCWNLAPPVLLAMSWFIINILHSFSISLSKVLNIVAWVFYVVLHFTIPPFIGAWLYFFHPPGALKLYALSIGAQNILVVLTHFVIPTAPPLFIKLYGEHKVPSFEMTYTDGITRQDMKFGSSMYRYVYYAIPNKFASCPSIHACTSSLVFFFVCYYSRTSIFKLMAMVYLFGQWWAALYLDHHWRFDIFAGLIYSIFVWTVIKTWKNGLNRIDSRFVSARSNADLINGTTMGMRIFKHTRIQNLFDPLASISK